MRLLRFISCMSIFLLPGMTFAAGTCSIENSTPPLLTKYIKEVQEKISETSRMSGACGAPKDGSFSNISKFEEVIDRIDAQNPVIPDTVTDFQYNITLAFNGESRDPVMRQGQVLRQLELNIIEALKSASYKCILDVKMSGKYSEFTPELLLSSTLTTNKKIESYFKQVAIGNA